MKEQKIFAASTDAVTDRELKNKEIAYNAALESIVLLKNDNSLPIKPGKIALFGAGVPMTVKGGTGSGEVNERHAVSILEGMENAGFEIVSRKWIDDYLLDYEASYNSWKNGFKLGFDMINYMSDSFQLPDGKTVSEDYIKDAVCDTAIYVVARQAGEGKDKKLERGEFDLTEDEIYSIKLLKKHYTNTILVINSGSYMNLAGLENEVNAVIFYCQQGMEGGRAFADIISGKASPSGKLTDTWANSYSDVPFADEYSYRNSDVKKQVYKEGIYVGYRYYDSYQIPVRYHFGHGLSYTKFEINYLDLSIENDKCIAKVKVKNIGDYSGKEIVQIYASCPDGKIKKEYQRLVAFEKTNLLLPGEEETVDLTFKFKDLASFDEANSNWLLESGDYLIRLGDNSAESKLCSVIRINEDIKLEHVKSACPVKEKFVEIEAVVRTLEVDYNDCPILTVNTDTLPCNNVTYELPKTIWSDETNKLLNSLTTKEMIDIVVGTGAYGMIDSSLNYAPGTVGRTTGKFVKKGLKNVNLSDGPAGLRLLKESALNKRGKLRFIKGNYMLSALNLLPDWLLKLVTLDKSKAKVLYQYTTAFPVGTALAQTWNTVLCESVGNAISKEMSEYGITYWLGPAMNIHKNPLCGRNFEYMSEDPLLTGKIAASLVRGAQSISGNYATIKHFACNNAEEQRTHSDSIIHERALREIYLRAFEICVKEAKPASVMTSYNLLNGIYTPNSYDLCTNILRCEWGFSGVVMTDWYSTGKTQGTGYATIAAGNDLIMPGGSYDKKSIKAGLKNGSLSIDALKLAAGNVIDAILKGSK